MLSSMSMSRSPGLILVAIAQFIISLISLASGIFLLLLLTGQMQVFSADLTRLSVYFKGLVIAGFGISLLGVAASIGLWYGKRWGWIGSLAFQSLCLLNNGLAIAGGQSPSFGVYFSAILSVALIGGLLLPGIRPPLSADALNRPLS